MHTALFVHLSRIMITAKENSFGSRPLSLYSGPWTALGTVVATHRSNSGPMSKEDPYTQALRNLRRGLADGKARQKSQEIKGEWLAARWPPYLDKRLEKTGKAAVCAEINSILQGTFPSWFKRKEIEDEERDVLEDKRAELRKELEEERQDRELESQAEQLGALELVTQEVHEAVCGRREAARKRGRRDVREEIAHMDPDELRNFVSECQQEFGVVPPPMKKPRLDTKAIPSLESLEQKWADEDEKGTTTILKLM